MKRILFTTVVITPLVCSAVVVAVAIATLGTVADFIYEKRRIKK